MRLSIRSARSTCRRELTYEIVRPTFAAASVRELTYDIALIFRQREVSLAQKEKKQRELNFSRTAVMGGVGRVVLRPLYDLVMRGGGKLDARSKWALAWYIQLIPKIGPRILRLIEFAVDVRFYSDARTADEGTEPSHPP